MSRSQPRPLGAVVPFRRPSPRTSFALRLDEALRRRPVHGIRLLRTIEMQRAVQTILDQKGLDFIRSMDRVEERQGQVVRTWTWETAADSYLAEWCGTDPAVLAGESFVLFLQRVPPEGIHAAMYVALPPYEIGMRPLDWHFRFCGAREVTAILPKHLGREYLARHAEAGFTVVKEDKWRWYVARRIP